MKFFTALMFLSLTLTALADCRISVQSYGPSGPVLAEEVVETMAAKYFRGHGFKVVRGENTQFRLRIHYLELINLNPKAPTTAGASLVFEDLEKSLVLARSAKEPLISLFLFMSDEAIAKTAVRSAMKSLRKQLTPCQGAE